MTGRKFSSSVGVKPRLPSRARSRRWSSPSFSSTPVHHARVVAHDGPILAGELVGKQHVQLAVLLGPVEERLAHVVVTGQDPGLDGVGPVYRVFPPHPVKQGVGLGQDLRVEQGILRSLNVGHGAFLIASQESNVSRCWHRSIVAAGFRNYFKNGPETLYSRPLLHVGPIFEIVFLKPTAAPPLARRPPQAKACGYGPRRRRLKPAATVHADITFRTAEIRAALP